MRLLTCTRCAAIVPVDEEPVEFIDPDRYKCGHCLRDVPGQLVMDDRPPETVRYDPNMSSWPAGF